MLCNVYVLNNPLKIWLIVISWSQAFGEGISIVLIPFNHLLWNSCNIVACLELGILFITHPICSTENHTFLEEAIPLPFPTRNVELQDYDEVYLFFFFILALLWSGNLTHKSCQHKSPNTTLDLFKYANSKGPHFLTDGMKEKYEPELLMLFCILYKYLLTNFSYAYLVWFEHWTELTTPRI